MNIPDLKEIAVAWVRAAKPTPEQQAIAEQRIDICNGCEFREFKNLIKTYSCSACGCPLNKKVFTPKGPEGCPKGKWPV